MNLKLRYTSLSVLSKITLVLTSLFIIACLTSAYAIPSRKVSVTAYSLYGITASGKITREGYIALSRDLLNKFPYGSSVRIVNSSCKGLSSGTKFLVQDTTARHVYNTMDIYISSYTTARNFGKCTATIARG